MSDTVEIIVQSSDTIELNITASDTVEVGLVESVYFGSDTVAPLTCDNNLITCDNNLIPCDYIAYIP